MPDHTQTDLDKLSQRVDERVSSTLSKEGTLQNQASQNLSSEKSLLRKLLRETRRDKKQPAGNANVSQPQYGSPGFSNSDSEDSMFYLLIFLGFIIHFMPTIARDYLGWNITSFYFAFIIINIAYFAFVQAYIDIKWAFGALVLTLSYDVFIGYITQTTALTFTVFMPIYWPWWALAAFIGTAKDFRQTQNRGVALFVIYFLIFAVADKPYTMFFAEKLSTEEAEILRSEQTQSAWDKSKAQARCLVSTFSPSANESYYDCINRINKKETEDTLTQTSKKLESVTLDFEKTDSTYVYTEQFPRISVYFKAENIIDEINVRFECEFPSATKKNFSIKGKIITPTGDVVLKENAKEIDVTCEPKENLSNEFRKVKFIANAHNITTTSQLPRIFVGSQKYDEKSLMANYIDTQWPFSKKTIGTKPTIVSVTSNTALASYSPLIGNPTRDVFIRSNKELILEHKIENLKTGKLTGVSEANLRLLPGIRLKDTGCGFRQEGNNIINTNIKVPPGDIGKSFDLRQCQLEIIDPQLLNTTEIVNTHFEGKLIYSYQYTKEIDFKII